MPIESVVADANVLLSAAVGKAALRVFTEFELEVHVAEFTAAEIREYLPSLSRQYGLPLELVETQWKLLPMKRHAREGYARRLPRARADLADVDPDDADALALARHLGLPLWSNDKDLPGHGVECHTTARLLARLAAERRPAA